MLILIKIAIRNLYQHRTKTIIMGVLVAIGVLVLVIGNTLINTLETGIERLFIDNYTGNIMITSSSINDNISLFGVNSSTGIKKTPLIPDYDRIVEYLESIPEITGVTSQITGSEILSIDSSEFQGKAQSVIFFGIQPDSYKKLFSNLKIVAGDYLRPGEKGMMISQANLDAINTNFESNLTVGDKVLVTASDSAGFKIREVPIIGVYNFKYNSEAANIISYIDAQTLRALKRMNLGKKRKDENSIEETDMLGLESYDSFFDTNIINGDNQAQLTLTDEEIFNLIEYKDEKNAKDRNVDNIGNDTILEGGLLNIEQHDSPNEHIIEFSDSSTWEYILIKTVNNKAASRIISRLNMWFLSHGINACAYDWEVAAGPFSKKASAIKIIFNVVIIIVAIVAIVIMINILIINIIVRTAEIGTLRALGAYKSFIRSMISIEVFIISVVFGFLGMIIGVTILLIISVIGIQASNSFWMLLFAGPILKPVLSVSSILGSWLTIILLGMFTNLFPLRKALMIQPIKAMMHE